MHVDTGRMFPPSSHDFDRTVQPTKARENVDRWTRCGAPVHQNFNSSLNLSLTATSNTLTFVSIHRFSGCACSEAARVKAQLFNDTRESSGGGFLVLFLTLSPLTEVYNNILYNLTVLLCLSFVFVYTKVKVVVLRSFSESHLPAVLLG